MKNIKIMIIASVVSLVTSVGFTAEKTDCSKIDTKTGSGWLKKALCKKGSDKLDSDGNFKKGTFNIFKKLKKS